MNKLKNDFFARSPEVVARELLGKILNVNFNGINKKARIVETEAYFDEKDPASRARQNGDLRKTMKMKPGTILVYGVHNNWLINFVTGSEGEASAVLIRAVEPLNFKGKGNGPGLLTKALGINKTFHKKHVFNDKEYLDLRNGKKDFEVLKSFRIGVKNDLPEKMRFHIKDNKHISKK